jgi:hypothetical protein
MKRRVTARPNTAPTRSSTDPGSTDPAVDVPVVREAVERVCTRKDVVDACKRRDLGAVIAAGRWAPVHNRPYPASEILPKGSCTDSAPQGPLSCASDPTPTLPSGKSSPWPGILMKQLWITRHPIARLLIWLWKLGRPGFFSGIPGLRFRFWRKAALRGWTSHRFAIMHCACRAWR